jgi:hypothetical protein
MVDAVLTSGLLLTPTARGSFLYHRFKAFQFLAAAAAAGGQMESEVLVGGSGSGKHKMVLSARIRHLTSAVSSWQQMAELNFFGGGSGGGGQYVLADPEKELTVVLSELALLHCLDGNHSAGSQLFLQSLELQRRTIDGYQRIRIATEDNIWAARETLTDTAINAATCLLHREDYRDNTTALLLIQHIQTLVSDPQLSLKQPQKENLLRNYLQQLIAQRPFKISKKLKRLSKVTSN